MAQEHRVYFKKYQNQNGNVALAHPTSERNTVAKPKVTAKLKTVAKPKKKDPRNAPKQNAIRGEENDS